MNDQISQERQRITKFNNSEAVNEENMLASPSLSPVMLDNPQLSTPESMRLL